jgi:hypothetical protein
MSRRTATLENQTPIPETRKAKLDIVTNVRKNLGHFDEVWSMPKDEIIFGRTKNYLEKAGMKYEVGGLGGKKIFKVRNDKTG